MKRSVCPFCCLACLRNVRDGIVAIFVSANDYLCIIYQKQTDEQRIMVVFDCIRIDLCCFYVDVA